MVLGRVYIATSLDGFIARRDGDLDWLMKQQTDGEDYGYDAFMDSVDGLIMGRGCYEKVLTFDSWPYSKPVVVLSRSLTARDVPGHLADKVRIANATPEQIMQTLAGEGWRSAYIDGGQIIQAFLRAGLISDMTLTRVPILLGDGLPLFGPLDNDIDVEHIKTETFASGLVHSFYKVIAA